MINPAAACSGKNDFIGVVFFGNFYGKIGVGKIFFAWEAAELGSSIFFRQRIIGKAVHITDDIIGIYAQFISRVQS